MLPSTPFLEQLIAKEIEGKNAAIHSYDKSLWSIRSGYLTLMFAGWGLLIKASVENEIEIVKLKPFVFLLGIFSLVIIVGAYVIDLNYAKRKFRVIAALNILTAFILNTKLDPMTEEAKTELITLLQVSGDTDKNSFLSKGYNNEKKVSDITYFFPVLVIIGIMIWIY